MEGFSHRYWLNYLLVDGDTGAEGESKFKLEVLKLNGVIAVSGDDSKDAEERISFAGFFGTAGFSRTFSTVTSVLFIEVGSDVPFKALDGIGWT